MTFSPFMRHCLSTASTSYFSWRSIDASSPVPVTPVTTLGYFSHSEASAALRFSPCVCARTSVHACVHVSGQRICTEEYFDILGQ